MSTSPAACPSYVVGLNAVADRTTRRAQSVVPFGVGAIVEFEDEALMSAGLDAWPEAGPRLYDERLAALVGVKNFREPPPKPERNARVPDAEWLPYVRFPQWHFCPRCRYLKKAGLDDQRRPICDNTHQSPYLRRGQGPCAKQPEQKRLRMVPLRFLVACPAGHIEDFPWFEWAHAKKGEPLERGRGCDDPLLYFYPSKIGGLAGLFVSCEKCKTRRSLMGTTGPNGLLGFSCEGHRPWLGEQGREPCPEPSDRSMFVLQRGASNIYFPIVASSILIPPFSSRVHVVAKKWEATLQASRANGSVPRSVFEAVAKQERIDVEQLIAAVNGDTSTPYGGANETEFRRAEYAALQQERRDEEDFLLCRPQNIEDYGTPIREWFTSLSLVEKLAETRALTGFNRISPGVSEPAALSLRRQRWLPGFRVLGEGIFLQLDLARLKQASDDHRARLEPLLRRIEATGRCRLEVSEELILIHSLAHALIKRLSWEAGYGTSSIRERIYTSQSDHHRMAGMLLYTAAGDADGTLGGLVQLGKAHTLERVMTGALNDAWWCASDPICRDSSGQGPESLNLAACHACMLLPETSCELQNRYLDRRSMVEVFG